MDPFNATNETSTWSWSEDQATTSNTTEGITVSSPSGAGGPSVQMIAVCTFLVAFGAVGTIGNFLVILSYKFEKKLQSNFQILIRNQAVADLMVCAIPIPTFSIYMLVGYYWPFGRFICGLQVLLDYGGCTATILAVIVICVDRLWATKWCHHYRRHNTRKKAAIMCFIVWAITAAIVGYPVISDRVLRTRDNECFLYVKDNPVFMSARTVLIMYIPAFVITGLYSIVFYEIRKLMKTRPGDTPVSVARCKVTPSANATPQAPVKVDDDRVTAQRTTEETTAGSGEQNVTDVKPGTSLRGECSKNTKSDDTKVGQQVEKSGDGKLQQGASAKNDPASKKTQKSEGKGGSPNKSRKSFITLSYIVLAYCICWIPWAILLNVSAAYPEIEGSDAYYAIAWLTYINSGLNPFLYALSSADFRSTAVKMMKFRYCRSP